MDRKQLSGAILSMLLSLAPAATAQDVAAPTATPQHVSVKSRLNFSAEEDRPSADQFLERIRPLAGDPGALDTMIQRWPDGALELLRASLANTSDAPLRRAVAESYDRVFESAASAGWGAALDVPDARQKTYLRFRKQRDEALSLFQSGRFADAARIDPVASLPSDAPGAIKAEAFRIAGFAALLNEKPDRAADLFARAVAALQNGPRHTRFELGLLLSEAERRRGHADAANAAWVAAAAGAGSVRDPNLWERALVAKTRETVWPAAIADANEPLTAGTAPDAADVLIGIGKMRLSRGFAQAALLAFSRAETETADASKQSLARLYRVQSMIALQQAASSLPMLEALIASPDPRIARRAQAVKGDVLCRILNDRRHGIALLREGLDSADGGDWPGRDRLAGNLGLYCILEGQDGEGLRRLHEAQARFEANGKWDDLASSLKNEAEWLQVAGLSQEASAARKRSEEVARKTTFVRSRLPEPR